MDRPIDMAIPPITGLWFDYLERETTQAILGYLEMRPPAQGEVYWRVPSFLTDVPSLSEKIKSGFDVVTPKQETI